MTENKQYTIRCDEFNAYSILKNNKDVIVFDLPKSDAELICNKLNELNDENQILKATNEEYEDALGRLEEENRDLKAFINELTSRDGRIWLSSEVYDVKKALKGDDGNDNETIYDNW